MKYLTVNLHSVGKQLFTPTFVSISNYPQNITFHPCLLRKYSWMVWCSLVFSLWITSILKCTWQKKDPSNDKSMCKIWGLEANLLGALVEVWFFLNFYSRVWAMWGDASWQGPEVPTQCRLHRCRCITLYLSKEHSCQTNGTTGTWYFNAPNGELWLWKKKKSPALLEPVTMKTESVKELESPTYLW